jgi:hypothetical protein
MHRINRRSPTFHPVNLPWVRQWKLCESVMVSILLAQKSQDWMDEHTFEVLTGVFLSVASSAVVPVVRLVQPSARFSYHFDRWNR